LNIAITLEDPDNLEREIRELGAGQADKIQNFVVAEVSKDYAEYQKKNYLSGQYLNKRTGGTYDSVKFFKLSDNNFAVRPGAGVSGRLNYLSLFETGGEITPKKAKRLAFNVNGNQVFARSVYIDRKPFVSDSFSAYVSSGKVETIMRRVWTKALKKKGLE